MAEINKSEIIEEKKIIKALNDTAKAMLGTEKQLLSLTSATQEFDKVTKKFTGTQKEVSDNQKKLAENTTKLTDAEKKQIRSKEQLKRAIKGERDEAKQLAIINDKQAGTLEKLIAKNKLLEIQKRKLTSTGKKLRAETLAFNRQIDKNNKIITENRAKSQGLTNSLKNMGKQFLTMTGLAGGAMIIIRKIGQVFKTAREDVRLFEDTFTNVLTLLDEAQKKQFEGILSAGAINLMARYGLAIEDVNQSLFDTISAGVPVGEALGFLNESAKLAIAGNSDLSDVVNGATTVMNAYGDKAGSTTDILNSFFAAQVEGKTTVGALASNVGKLASTAASADIPVTELLGTFAGLTKFLDGSEESATAMVNVINALIKPSEKAKKTFSSLGIETGITAVKQEGLLTKLLQVAAAYEGNNDVLADLIPNIRAFKGIAGLSASTIAEIETNVLALNDTQAASLLVQDAFNEKMETGTRQGKQAKSVWKAFFIELGGGESIFKKVESFFNNILIKAGENSVTVVRGLRIAVAKLFDVFRKEGEKRAEAIFLEYANANKDIVENEKETTVELTEEQKRRQEANNEIRRKAAAAQSEEELAAAKKIADEKLRIFLEADKQRLADDEFMAAIEAGNEQFLQDQILEGKRETARIEEEINQKAIDDAKEGYDRDLENYTAAQQAKQDLLIDIANQGFEFTSELFARQASKFDEEKQRELEAAGDNEEQREAIEEKFAKKQNEIRRKQAIADKLQALFNIGINTAVGITNALSKVATIPLVPFITILGALQAATVAAAPIPQFWKGVKGFGGGMADVGERGREMIETPNGVFMSPDTRTRMYLPPGTNVIPNPETEKAIESNEVEGLKELAQSNDNLAKSIKNRPENHVNITEGGIGYLQKRGQSTTTYLNKYFRK